MTPQQMMSRILFLEGEVTALRKQIEGHCERIVVQSELLSKRAEHGKQERYAENTHPLVRD